MPISCHKQILCFVCMMLMGWTAAAQSPAIQQWAAPKTRLQKLQNTPRRVSSDLIRMQERHNTGVSSASGVSGQKDPMEEWIRHVNGLPELEICLDTSDPEKIKQAEEYLAGLGMSVTYVSQKYGRIYGTVDFGQMDAVDNTPHLSFVYPSYLPMTRSGTVTSQGDAAMATEVIRGQYGLTGAGVTVGVISDSMDHDQNGLDTYIASGNLPGPGNPNGDTTPVEILVDDTGNDKYDEGCAMAEIIHDVAPGAKLAFHAAFLGGKAGLADAFTNLKEYGADIIVDDVTYLNQSCFQDGIVAQAAQAAADAGVLLFSSAGNVADHALEMPYKDIAPDNDDDPYYMGNDLHDFGDNQPFTRISVHPEGSIRATLWWSEPYDGILGPGASTDLDLYFYDSDTGKLIANSDTSQGCTFGAGAKGGDAFEFTGFTNNSDETITVDMIVDRACGSGEGLMLKIGLWGWGVEFDPSLFNAPTVFGHPATEGVIAVGAVNWAETDAYNDPPRDSIPVEDFSSLGDRIPIYFDENGHRLDNAPVIRSKPEIAAPDGVGTTTPYFETFFGTSAAAPHAGALAALLMESARASGLTDPRLITDCMRAGAKDIAAPLWDGYSGNGLVNGPTALRLVESGAEGVFAVHAGSGSHGSIYPSGRMIGYAPSYGISAAHPVIFTFEPAPYFHVSDILVNGQSAGALPGYTFDQEKEDKTIYAEFAPDLFHIAASATTGGTIAPAGDVAVTHFDTPTFVMTPETGYRLLDVKVDGESKGALESVTFSETDEDHTIEANFAVNTYAVTPSVQGNGRITPADTQIVPYGSDLDFVIRADAGHHIAGVRVNGQPTGEVGTDSFTLYLSHIAGPMSVQANFVVNTYTLTPDAPAHCAIEPATPQAVAYGESVAFVLRPETGYQISDILVDGMSTGPADSYLFSNTSADHVLSATVEKIPETRSGSGGICFISIL